MSSVSVVRCETYELTALRRSVRTALAPLGGIERFVRPGMRVLLKPNMLTAVGPERAVTTHPAVLLATAELVQQAGGTVLIGDSPAGPVGRASEVFRVSGVAEAAARLGVDQVPFDSVIWKRLNGRDYFVARAISEADLVINLPKLKTHQLTLYTGAVKNMFGAIPGTRKRELHLQAPGVVDFSRVLVDVLELAQPHLTVMDGILGLEGNGPGRAGTPRAYGCLLASTDPVALDAVVARALGYRPGQVRYLKLASDRGLGTTITDDVEVIGDRGALSFGSVRLPGPHWYFHAPSWVTRPFTGLLTIRPLVRASACVGCGRCAEVCPREAISWGDPPVFDLDECIGCMCCAEVCPQGAIEPRRSLLARVIGLGE